MVPPRGSKFTYLNQTAKGIHTCEALNDGLIGRCGVNGFAVLVPDDLNFFACLELVHEWAGLKRFPRNSNGENGG